MTTITLKEMTCSYGRNSGCHCEQWLAYTLTGEIRKHDSVPFDKGSDIPEFDLSVKSARATLCSANLLTATDKAGQIAEYFARVHSSVFAFVSLSGVAYIMDKTEFERFVNRFGKWEQESAKNGGKYKVRFPAESKAMKEWFRNNS